MNQDFAFSQLLRAYRRGIISEAAFERTLAAVGAAEITRVHTFPYSPRPGTVTAGADTVPRLVKKERSARLRALSHDACLRRLLEKLGAEDVVLVDRPGRGYGAKFRVTTAVQLQYRVSLIIWLIGLILQPGIYLVVWTTVAGSRMAWAPACTTTTLSNERKASNSSLQFPPGHFPYFLGRYKNCMLNGADGRSHSYSNKEARRASYRSDQP